eukprot:752929-Hanusia_phi.AAC.3
MGGEWREGRVDRGRERRGGRRREWREEIEGRGERGEGRGERKVLCPIRCVGTKRSDKKLMPNKC